jgi:hypothetical protein
MYYYCYKIIFVDGFFYIGSRKSSVQPIEDAYYGSPVTHKDKWYTTMYQKEIICKYDQYGEMLDQECELIRQTIHDEKSLNKAIGKRIAPDRALVGARKAGKKKGALDAKNKTSLCDPVNQEKGRQTSRENRIGFYNPEFQKQFAEQRVKNGCRARDEGLAIFAPEYRGVCKGTKWWTNGEQNKRSKTCPGENWTLGRSSYAKGKNS